MNRHELVVEIAKDHELTVAESDRIVNNIFDRITADLMAGNKVTFTGFGTFSVVERAARTGRNPKTGDSLEIAAKKAVKFKAGSKLSTTVKG